METRGLDRIRKQIRRRGANTATRESTRRNDRVWVLPVVKQGLAVLHACFDFDKEQRYCILGCVIQSQALPSLSSFSAGAYATANFIFNPTGLSLSLSRSLRTVLAVAGEVAVDAARIYEP